MRVFQKFDLELKNGLKATIRAFQMKYNSI